MKQHFWGTFFIISFVSIDIRLYYRNLNMNTFETSSRFSGYNIVHVTNGIKRNCNCCDCACWNVGSIKRRKIPRDVLMSTYFIRVTDEGRCTSCGNCTGICPVDAVTVKDEIAVVDEQWCIGCGLCVRQCPNQASVLKLRLAGFLL